MPDKKCKHSCSASLCHPFALCFPSVPSYAFHLFHLTAFHLGKNMHHYQIRCFNGMGFMNRYWLQVSKKILESSCRPYALRNNSKSATVSLLFDTVINHRNWCRNVLSEAAMYWPSSEAKGHVAAIEGQWIYALSCKWVGSSATLTNRNSTRLRLSPWGKPEMNFKVHCWTSN